MPVDQIQTSEQLVFDGALGVTTASLLGVLFAAAAAWLLWRDRLVLGMRWAMTFWALRMVAIAVALWMAVGPVRETVERVTKSQSVAILSDASGSMATVDPPDPEASIRWQLANEAADNPSALVHCDRARVAVGSASQACQKAQRYIDEHRPLRQIEILLTQIGAAISRTRQHCEAVSSELVGQNESLYDRISRIELQLDGPIADALDSAQVTLNESVVSQIASSLEVLSEGVQGVTRRLDSLVRDMTVDMIANMSLASEQMAGLTRRERTGRALDVLEQSVLGDLPDDVRVRRFRFDQRLQTVAAENGWLETDQRLEDLEQKTEEGSITNLSAVLQQLAADRSSESTRLAILVSDGHHNDPDAPPPQEIATELADLPVHVVPVGNVATVRDIRLHRVEAPATVVEKDSGVIDAIVTALDCDGLTAEIVLRHEGQEIDRKPLEFVGERVDRRVQFRVPAEETGWKEYELAVDPIDEEASTANNVALVSWEVVRDKFRVLLADNVSQWEYRYLQQLFRRDSHIEFDELLYHPRLRGTGQMAANPRLPSTIDDWSVYDVVILGDINGANFNRESQQALAEYVHQGQGHLILIAGRDHMPQDYEGQPLVELLPVEDAGVQGNSHVIALTDEGRLHTALAIEDSATESETTWVDVYQRNPIHSLSAFCRPKPTARTLIRAVPADEAVMFDEKASRDEQQAFLCWHQVGAGRVVYLAAPQTYQLRFRRGDRQHHLFWGQMLRWITAANLGSGSELVRMTTDQTRYRVNQPVEVTVWLKDQTGRPLADQALNVKARTLDNDVATVALEPDAEVAGRYFSRIERLQPGAYEIIVEGPAIDELSSTAEVPQEVRRTISIEPHDNIEMLDTRCNLALLEQVAEVSGGQVVPPTALDEVFRLASLSPEVHETVHRTPIWNRWVNLWIVVGCLTVEWIARKQKGLV